MFYINATKASIMNISSEDIIPFGQVRAKFTQLAEKAHAGQEHIHLLLLQEVVQGLDDVEANRLLDISDLREKYSR